MSIGRSSIDSCTFSILGSSEIQKQSSAIITNKALFSEGIPIANGLYDPHLGTTELSWNCATCFLSKNKCPGHSGSGRMNYPLQNAMFRKEIPKWIRIFCHKCGDFVTKREVPFGVPRANILAEYAKLVRSSNEKHKICQNCKEEHPWIVRDQLKPGIYWQEWYSKGNKTKPDRREILYNHQIKSILDRISDQNIIKMGKSLESSPKKLILEWIKISTTLIRPEIRKIGGNRSTTSDITAMLRTIYELNSQIPKEIPAQVDTDLHGKLVMVDLTFFEMIQGSSNTTGALSIVTNTNKVSNSFAARLPKKHGRIRGNIMGKRALKMARSVITGDKALRPDQLGVPRSIAKNLYIPVTVHEWNRAELMTCFQNGLKRYPGCSKVKRKATGYEHLAENMDKDYVLQDGDVLYRNIKDGDVCCFNREPALLFCAIAMHVIKVIDGLTFRINSVVCALYNKSVL